jgi:hypothetical protein
MRRSRRVLALAVASAAACSSDDFEPVSYVDTLRVLAVRADQSWAAPSETVHLDTLLADPTGGGRAVSWAWSTCLDPGSEELSACRAAAGPFTPGGPTLDVTVPASASTAPGTVGVLFAACAGTLSMAPTAAAPVTCVDASGRTNDRGSFMWGEKRILVVDGVRNANPRIADVLLDGTSWRESGDVRSIAPCDQGHVSDCDASLRHRIEIVPAPGSAETVDGQTELLVAFFFVSSGGVADDFARADVGKLATDLATIHTPPKTPATAWLVLRDDRGGVDWAVRSYATP